MFAQLIVDGMQVGAMYALMASGFAVIFGTTRVLHYAHGSSYLIAGYTFFALVQFGASFAISALAATAASIAFGLLVNRFVYRRIQRDERAFFTIFVASFGIAIVVENVVKTVFGNDYTVIETPLSRSVPLFHAVLASPLLGILLVVSALVFIVLWWLFNRTDLGVALRGLSERPELINSFGMSSATLSHSAFALGSALVAPAAIAAICSTGMVPSSGHHIVLISLVATIIGGVGSVVGAAIGGFLLGMIESLSVWKLSTNWSEAVAFFVLVGFILVRPSGLFTFRGRV